MGSIEHVDQLETYINDLGVEIENVKKASEYMRLIEGFQSEIKQTSSTLTESSNRLKLIQEIVESKLELIQASTRTIEAKQQSLEQYASNISTSTEEITKRLKNHEIATVSSFKEVNSLVNSKHDILVEEMKNIQVENKTRLQGISKVNKIYFAINATLSTTVLGTLAYLIIKLL